MKFSDKSTAFAAALTFLVFTAPSISCQEYEPASDTDLHIIAGIAASFGSVPFLVLAAKGDRLDPLTVTAAAAAAAVSAGIIKEMFDYLGLGTPEMRDLLNTAFGGVVGVGALSFYYYAFPKTNFGIERDLGFTFFSLSFAMCIPMLQHFIELSFR